MEIMMSSQLDPAEQRRVPIPEAQLARRWGRSVRTLQRWRREGRGPSWLKIGAGVYYRLDDVEAFEDAARREVGK